jgi:hypothetical protein
MGNHMFRNRISAGLIGIAIASLLAASSSGCKHRSGTAADDSTASSKPTPATEFERDLQVVRNMQYTYVWVLSRKDGKPFDKEDGDYLRKYAVGVEWVGTDGGKRYIGSTNFDLDAATWELLKKRFVVEDYSGK